MPRSTQKKIYLPITTFQVAERMYHKGGGDWEEHVRASCAVFACSEKIFLRSFREMMDWKADTMRRRRERLGIQGYSLGGIGSGQSRPRLPWYAMRVIPGQSEGTPKIQESTWVLHFHDACRFTFP